MAGFFRRQCPVKGMARAVGFGLLTGMASRGGAPEGPVLIDTRVRNRGSGRRKVRVALRLWVREV